jgi:hypothetical protein
MKPDSDMTVSHVNRSCGGSALLWSLHLIVAALLILPVGVAQAEDTVSDSARSTMTFLLEEPRNSEENVNYFTGGIALLATTESDEINNGFGLGFFGRFEGIPPLVATAGFEMAISSMDAEGLPDGDFIILSPAIELAIRGSVARIRPFAGVGVNLNFNHLSFDEPDFASISGYDTTTQAKQIDMGWGVAPQARAGVEIPIGKVNLLLQSRFWWVSHTADIHYRDRYTGEEWKGRVDYDIPSVWLSLGIIKKL